MRSFGQLCLVGTCGESQWVLQNAYILYEGRKDIVCLHDITICFGLRANRIVFEDECDFTHGTNKLLREMIRVNQFFRCVEYWHYRAIIVPFGGRPESFILRINSVSSGLFLSFLVYKLQKEKM